MAGVGRPQRRRAVIGSSSEHAQRAAEAVHSATVSIERMSLRAQDALACLLIDRALKGLAAITDDLSFLHEMEPTSRWGDPGEDIA